MKSFRQMCCALGSLALACGGDSSGASDDSTGETGGTEMTESADDGPASDPSNPSDPDEDDDSPVDTTAGPMGECDRTVRFPLYDGQACGRVLVGMVDFDNNADIIAFGHSTTFIDIPVPTTMQTFLGDGEGLNEGKVHCCLETSIAGAGAIFDINGDGNGDPIWAGERTVVSGDVGSTEWTIEKSIRAPEQGYVFDGVLFASQDTPPPFIVGRITPDTTGVIVVADGMLLSMVGNGDELGLEATNTLVLDPAPTIVALATIELDGQAGIDVVGLGPDGLYLWGGSVDGEFADATLIELPGEYTDIESIDVDLDGARELVLFGVDQPIAVVDRTNMVVVTTTDMPVVPPPATVIEVDGDLYPDVVGVEGDSLVMYPGNGDVFGAAVALAPIGAIADLAHGDLDGNGTSDIVACDDQGLLVVYRPE